MPDLADYLGDGVPDLTEVLGKCGSCANPLTATQQGQFICPCCKRRAKTEADNANCGDCCCGWETIDEDGVCPDCGEVRT